jgi:hypothetical protein
MPQIVLDEALIAKFKDLHERAELRDSAGNLLGFFTPAYDKYERVDPEISAEELDRIRQEPTFSTEEVLAHLRGL